MDKLIIVIVVYVVWSFVKNILREAGKSGSVTGTVNTPPIVYSPNVNKRFVQKELYEKKSEDRTISNAISDEVNKKAENESLSSDRIMKHEEDRNIITPSSESDNTIKDIELEENIEFPLLTAKSVYNGIIMAELLGPPKAHR